MSLVIASLVIFLIGTVSFIVETARRPTGLKIITSIIFIVTWFTALIWALEEFVN